MGGNSAGAEWAKGVDFASINRMNRIKTDKYEPDSRLAK